MPALIILIDEYAELVDDAPAAIRHADSIARRGRAVAVSLVAATQRPTQKAMGHGAVRSQMDVRICFRVRERKDVDLILGQGMLAAGWQAHTLDAPGKFLVSAAEHDTPRRGRAYLITDEVVASTAERTPTSGPTSTRCHGRRSKSRTVTEPAATATGEADETQGSSSDAEAKRGGANDEPEAILWAALSLAPDEGTTVTELMAATGMSRPWVYRAAAQTRRTRPGDPGQPRPVALRQAVTMSDRPRPRATRASARNRRTNRREDEDVDDHAELQNERSCPGKATTRGGDRSMQAYTVEQVAKMLNIGRDKVYYLLRTRQLRSIKIGKSRRITEEQLAEFIASQEDAA